MVPTFDIAGTHELSSAEMQCIVGGDGWLQTIASAWSTGIGAIGSALTSVFSSSGSMTNSVPMNKTLA